MQSRRWLHGSSGELGVFGATRYFAGRADDCDTAAQPAPDRLTQAKVATHDTKMIAESFRGHDDEKLGVHDLELAKPNPKLGGKRQLAVTFSSFMLSPSPGASFRRRMPQSPTTKSTAAGDESVKFSLSSTSSSRDDLEASGASVRLGGPGGYGLDDLGVATGDRRLQGVKVVRSNGGDEERWVVTCCAPCWDQEEEMFEHPDQLQGEDGTDPPGWETDSISSSDLFDLDIESFEDL